MTNCSSQVNRLTKYFKSGGSITSYEAFAKFGVTQLAARITEIEARGIQLSRTPEKRNGKRYVRYSLLCQSAGGAPESFGEPYRTIIVQILSAIPPCKDARETSYLWQVKYLAAKQLFNSKTEHLQHNSNIYTEVMDFFDDVYIVGASHKGVK